MCSSDLEGLVVGECSRGGDSAELCIGSGGSEKVGEPGSQFPVADRSLFWSRGRGLRFVEEGRGSEEASEGESEGFLVREFLAAKLMVEAPELLSLILGDRSAIDLWCKGDQSIEVGGFRRQEGLLKLGRDRKSGV